MNFEILITFFFTSVGITLSPGPDILYVLVQSISNGKVSGIAVTSGLVSGILIHTTAVAFGVSQLIIQSEFLFLSIKILGACYLLFIAYTVFRTPSEFKKTTTIPPKKSFSKLYRQGFLMNVSNPKVTLFFFAFFPAFLPKTTDNIILNSYTLGIIFMIQAFLVFSTVAILADRFTVFLRTNHRFLKTLKWFQIGIYIGLALFLFL